MLGTCIMVHVIDGTAVGDQPAGALGGGDPYPPAPWELYGDAQVHLLAVRTARLEGVPQGFQPLSLGGYTPVIAGAINYTGGSVLRYSELLVAVVGLVGGHRPPTATVTHMWVDSEASRRGGKELWGYPKEIARFEGAFDPGGKAVASDGKGELATVEFKPWLALPLCPRWRGGTVQPLGGELRAVRARMAGRPVLGRGRFRPAPSGPLAFLGGARILLSLGLKDFHFTFGI